MEGQPSFEKIAAHLKENPGSTIQELAEAFDKTDDDTVITMLKPGCKKKNYVVAVNVQSDFWTHMQRFSNEPYVDMQLSPLSCMITDSVRYTGPDEFVPLVWNIKA
uniref:Uncharacterized protein n=1 Tax=Pithovirus LCPAC304 TaxID=2506594 RepID=A0A481Z8P3_9VIRU|nr:MAG: hypothetical protein LCPAC304_06300 [Pithovirus LCPAC304]